MKTLLMILRSILGMGQSALLLGGCAGLFVGNGGLLNLCLVGFLVLTGAQILIFALAVLLFRDEKPSDGEEE